MNLLKSHTKVDRKIKLLVGSMFQEKENFKSKPFNSEIRAFIKYRKDVRRTFLLTESK